jgi:hypothetical protein
MSTAFTTFKARRLAEERRQRNAQLEAQRSAPLADLVEEQVCMPSPQRRLPRKDRIAAYEAQIAQASLELQGWPISSPEYVLLRQKRSAMIHNMKKLKRWDGNVQAILGHVPQPDLETCTVEELYRYYTGAQLLGTTTHPWTREACLTMGLVWYRCEGGFPRHRHLDSAYNLPGEGPIRRFWPLFHDYHCAIAEALGIPAPVRGIIGRPSKESRQWHGTEGPQV